jgi:hemolysin type calcium-binding protein
MNRLYPLLTVMVVMVGAPFFFVTHEALAEVFAGTDGNDTLFGTEGDDRLKGRGGDDKIYPGEGDDEVYAGSGNDDIYARDTNGVDYIDCGAGRRDEVETIHRDDRTLSNCERALGPSKGNIDDNGP